MTKKVLITGITGQDGSYMTDFLLESTNFEILEWLEDPPSRTTQI